MENEMKKKVEEINKDERGLAAVEYVIMAAFVIAALVAGVTVFGDKLKLAFTELGDQMDSARPE